MTLRRGETLLRGVTLHRGLDVPPDVLWGGPFKVDFASSNTGGKLLTVLNCEQACKGFARDGAGLGRGAKC